MDIKISQSIYRELRTQASFHKCFQKQNELHNIIYVSSPLISFSHLLLSSLLPLSPSPSLSLPPDKPRPGLPPPTLTYLWSVNWIGMRMLIPMGFWDVVVSLRSSDAIEGGSRWFRVRSHVLKVYPVSCIHLGKIGFTDFICAVTRGTPDSAFVARSWSIFLLAVMVGEPEHVIEVNLPLLKFLPRCPFVNSITMASTSSDTMRKSRNQ